MYSNMILNYVEAAASGPIYESEVSMGIERVNNALIPYVIEQSPRGERSYDIYSRLLNDPCHLPWRRGHGRFGKYRHRAAPASRERRSR